MPIFRVKSVKIYTGQIFFTQACLWCLWQIKGMIRWPSKLQSSWGRLTAAPGLASHAQGWLALIWRIALGDLYWPRCILFLAVSSQRVRTFHVADQSMPSTVVCDQVQHCERRMIQMIFGFNLNTMTKGCKEKHRPRYFPLNVVLVLKTLPQLLTSQ